MKTVATGVAIAGLLVFTAGSTAWAQSYSTNPSNQSYSSQSTQSSNPTPYNPNQGSWSPSTQSSSTYPSTQSTSNQGNSANQGTWSSGMHGTSTPSGGQYNTQAGYGAGNVTTFQQAEQELSRYGYNNVHDLRAMQGWSADAMRNGQRVHVILGDNGMIATFPGR